MGSGMWVDSCAEVDRFFDFSIGDEDSVAFRTRGRWDGSSVPQSLNPRFLSLGLYGGSKDITRKVALLPRDPNSPK